MTRPPSIIDVANTIAQKPGFDPPTPRWAATLSYTYGLDLSDEQVALLAAATRRSPEAIRAHVRRTLGKRRFRALWARVGRRGRKSATAALIAVYEAIWGGHEADVLPGEQALCAVISKDLAGASVVTRFVRLYLDALGIRYSSTRIGAVSIVEIEGCQVGIATLAAASEAPRGYALPVIVLDEFAHHPITEKYQNNADSLLDAALPAQLQFANPLIVGISTPLGNKGRFHKEVEAALGNDADERTLAVQGASWEWGDVTEEHVRAEITDPRIFDREALARPQESVLGAFAAQLIYRAFQPRELEFPAAPAVMILDPSSGGQASRNAFAWGIAHYCTDDLSAYPAHQVYQRNKANQICRHPWGEPILLDKFRDWAPRGRPYLKLRECGAIEGGFEGTITGDQIADHLERIARRHRVRTIHSDQRESLFLGAALNRRGFAFHSHVWTAPSKADAVTLVRRWLSDGALSLPPEAHELRNQLLSFEEVVTASGQLTFGARGSNGRDDFVALLITAAHAEMSDHPLPRSPRRVGWSEERRQQLEEIAKIL